MRIVAGVERSTATLDSHGRSVLVVGTFPAVLANYVGSGGPFDRMALIDVGGVRYRTNTLSGRALCLEVSPSLFDIITTRPVLGRALVEHDEQSAEGIALVRETFWRSELGGSMSAVGELIAVQSVPHRIVGVFGFDLDVLGGADIVIAKRRLIPGPLVDNSAAEGVNARGVLMRLRTGVTAGAALQVLGAGGAADKRMGVPLGVIPLREALRSQFRALLGVLSGGALLVIVSGWSTITLLYVGLLRSRLKEVAIQLSLGAGLRALLMPYIKQWAALAAISTAASVGLFGLMASAWRAAFPRFAHFIPLDGSTWVAGLLAIAMAVAGCLVGLCFCAVSVSRLRSARLAPLLNDGVAGAQLFGRRAGERVSMILQIGCGVALFACSIMLCRTAVIEMVRDRGFTPENLIVIDLVQPELAVPAAPGKPTSRAETDRRRVEYESRTTLFYLDVLQALRTVPHAVSVGATSRLPMSPIGASGQFIDTGNARQGRSADVIEVSGDFFSAVDARLRIGTTFDRTATAAAEWTAVVTESIATKLWPQQNPVGQVLRVNLGRSRRVVGVVSRMDVTGLGFDFPGQVFVPNTQPVHFVRNDLSVVIRTQPGASIPLRELRTRVESAYPGTMIYGFRSGGDLQTQALRPLLARTVLSAAIAMGMILLSCLAIWGAIRQWIVEYHRELQIRAVLGATPLILVTRVLSRALVMVFAGVAAGLLLAIVATRLIGFDLVGITFTFVDVLPGVIAATLIVGIVSYYGAARAVADMQLKRV